MPVIEKTFILDGTAIEHNYDIRLPEHPTEDDISVYEKICGYIEGLDEDNVSGCITVASRVINNMIKNSNSKVTVVEW